MFEIVPLVRSYQPGQPVAGQVGCGLVVQNEQGVFVLLKEGSRNLIVDRTFNGFLDDGCFAVAPGHEQDTAGSQNGADPHGDGPTWVYTLCQLP